MGYARFAIYNVTGGIAWVLMFTLGGYYFAELPVVKTQFHYVILAIIIISCLPAAIEYLRARRQRGRPAPVGAGPGPAARSEAGGAPVDPPED
jgi:membrane-associated protein